MCIVCYNNYHIIFNSLFEPGVKKIKMVDFSKGSLKIVENGKNIHNVLYSE